MLTIALVPIPKVARRRPGSSPMCKPWLCAPVRTCWIMDMLIASLSPKICPDESSGMSGKPFETTAWRVPQKYEAVFCRASSRIHSLGNHTHRVVTKSICPSPVQGLGCLSTAGFVNCSGFLTAKNLISLYLVKGFFFFKHFLKNV